jgi:hypothetical protein
MGVKITLESRLADVLSRTHPRLLADALAALAATPSEEATGLDVERLAKALHQQFWVDEIVHAPDGELACLDMEERSAREVAAEYARLTASDGGRE